MKIKSILSLVCLAVLATTANAQTVLKADGSTDTYKLINSVLAPGYDAVEPPDCNHTDFGPHITQVFDADLQRNVFAFHIHVTPDNDRCIKFDRQRNEIKTYASSPDNLLATEGETVIYKWLFKIPIGYQPSSSFTHLHQIKAVGGPEEGMPLITLTARKASPNRLQLRYAANLDQSTIKEVNFDQIEGQWIEVTEELTVGEQGKYSITLQNVSTQAIVLQYSSNNMRIWKTDADFLRPKWGIYRSLLDKDNLRDEIVHFADFSIQEIKTNTALFAPYISNAKYRVFPNPTTSKLTIEGLSGGNNFTTLIYDSLGQIVLSAPFRSQTVSTDSLRSGQYYLMVRDSSKIVTVISFIKE